MGGQQYFFDRVEIEFGITDSDFLKIVTIIKDFNHGKDAFGRACIGRTLQRGVIGMIRGLGGKRMRLVYGFHNLLLLAGIDDIVIKNIAVTVFKYTGDKIAVQPVRLFEKVAEHGGILGIGQIVGLIISDHRPSYIIAQKRHIRDLGSILQKHIKSEAGLG